MKVLIVDDHWMIRSSLKQAFETIDPSLQTLDAASVKAASEMLTLHPDVDLMFIDLVMPGLSDLDALRSLRRQYPDIPIAVISVHEDRDHIMQAISEGAIGYIPKSAEGAELLRALTLVLTGGVYFPRDILQNSPRSQPLATDRPKVNTQPGVTSSPTLTTREDQVLDLILLGRTNNDIAQELGLSPNTVRVHLRNLSLKLNLKDRNEIAAYRAAQQASSRRTS